MRAVLIMSPGGPEVLQVQEVENPRIGDDEVLIKIGATALNRADTLQRKGSYPPPEGASPYPRLECAGTVESAGKNVTRWTVGDEEVEKLTFCKELGADVCINYKTEDFVARVKEETGGKGVDVILDNVGGPYFQRNLNSLNVNGRLFIIGFQGGTITEANLRCMLARCLTVQAVGLRTRSPENKALIVSEVEKNVWPAIVAGKVKPVVYKSFPLSEAAEAQRLMESSKHIGKILLIP
ncbi:hypothetical protein MRB53_021787 [Persea americana]|uniref:Uncharacterized protein n=1 Tax=Persea americana TaxID=3435 RepID=A0ACC2L577_PERAE|nr:hypothetical protein MRB53_021787 [Persea americana]